jgi:hypothetical protein
MARPGDALMNAKRGGKRAPIGPIKKGAFHAWLGKPQSEPITDADIRKGLKAGGHPAKMANFARNFGK